MHVRRTIARLAEKIDINMTPMIDIVFQLMAFFIMTLKIVTLEGDFNIRMPKGGAIGPAPLATLPLRLTALPDGELASIRLGDRDLRDFDELRAAVREIVGDAVGPDSLRDDAEVEIDADPHLSYTHIVAAITAVSGHLGPDKRIVPLTEKIKFAPPRAPD